LEDLAGLLAGVAGCVNLWSAYGLVQCLVLVFTLLRLLTSWSFQTRLGIITTTLLSSLPQIGHLLIVYVVSLCTYAGMLILILGPRTSAADSYGSALYELLMGLLGGPDLVLATMYPEGLAQTQAQAFAVGLIYYTREFLFIMLLMQFFMATIGGVFVQVKAAALERMTAMQLQETAGGNGAGSAPGSITWDLSKHVLPELAAAVRAASLRPKRLTNSSRSQEIVGVDMQRSSIVSSNDNFVSKLHIGNGGSSMQSPKYKCQTALTGRAGCYGSRSAQDLLSWIGEVNGRQPYAQQAVAGQNGYGSMPVFDKVGF
jgi:hypothetical protein